MLSALARRLSARLAPADAANLALQDALNAALPWLWWPVGVPATERPMPRAAHALYLVHALVIARAVRLRPARAWGLVTVLSWAVFTGAWDRRAAITRK